MVAAPEIVAPVGRVRGTSADLPVMTFLGVPYAVPPLAHRRFMPPEQHGGWSGTRDASRTGPQAPQAASMLDSMMGSGAASTSEDCLTLNIWTPDPGASLPVMVWIHGGGFLSGSGSIPWYDGTRLARHGDVVVVTINYRLGALGFLHLDDVDGSGVAGLLDQVMALRWVRDNISAFGGDPARVTVFGESAGAMSTACLLGAPAADGLFTQAVLQSGAARHVIPVDGAAAARRAFARHAGIAEGAPSDTWRAASPESLVAAQNALLMEGGFGALPFVPVVDGTHLHHPLERLRRNPTGLRRLLIGTTQDEMRLFTSFDPAVQSLDRSGVVARTKRLRAPEPEALVDDRAARRPGLGWADIWSSISTDDVFRMAADQLIDTAAGAGVECWSYLFAWPTPAFGGRFGSPHAIEIPFVFDNLHLPGVSMLLGTGTELSAIASSLSGAWRAFANGASPWPAHGADRTTAVVNAAGRIEVASDPHGADRREWGDRWFERVDTSGDAWQSLAP